MERSFAAEVKQLAFRERAGPARRWFLRPSFLRYTRESALMARWKHAVLQAAAVDQALAVEVAEVARVVKIQPAAGA